MQDGWVVLRRDFVWWFDLIVMCWDELGDEWDKMWWMELEI